MKMYRQGLGAGFALIFMVNGASLTWAQEATDYEKCVALCTFGGLIEGAVASASAIIMSGGLLAGPAATGVVEGGNAGALVGTVLCPWLISKKGKKAK